MDKLHLESLGEPVISVGALSLWVHGYESPAATDGWDGNWLTVTARCVGKGASVIVYGGILDTVSFQRLQRQLAVLQQKRTGSATLKSHEPFLNVTFTAVGNSGRVDVETDITPDDVRQRHRFFDTVNESDLSVIQSACDVVLRAYPVRHPELRGDVDPE